MPAGLRASVAALAGADSPEAVAAIWADLTESERAELLRSRPEFVGNLEGVPYAVRFAANREVYDETIAGGPYGEPLDGQLEQLGIEMDRQDGELLMFHPFEQPQATAAVVYGVRRDAAGEIIDPFAGVTNVNVLVGGMFSGLGDLEAWGESARNLNAFAEAYGGAGTATSFESDGGTAPSLQDTPEPVAGTPGHAAHDGGNSLWGWWEQDNGYLSRDSESFRNIAYIVANGEVLP